MQIFSKDERQTGELLGAITIHNDSHVIIVAVKTSQLMPSCMDLLQGVNLGYFSFHHESELMKVNSHTAITDINDHTIYKFYLNGDQS